MATIQLQLKDYICIAPPGDMFYGKRKARTFYLLPLTLMNIFILSAFLEHPMKYLKALKRVSLRYHPFLVKP